MDVFDGNQSSQNDANQNDGNQSYVEALVKARGEQWKDPEVIAKGKLEADRHIEDLTKKLRELEESSASSKKLEDLVAQIEKATKSNPNTESDTKTSVSEADIQSLVEKTLTKKEAESTAKQNLDLVNSQLAESFGDEAGSVVQKKAQELGLSLDRLKSLAAESPSAFLTLIGEKPKQVKVNTEGSIKTEGLSTTTRKDTRNNAFYQEMRRKNPQLFYSAATMNQMIADRQRMGDAFYN